MELQILSVLWRWGALTARQVLERMPDQKKRAYTSILSVLQVMAKKGLVVQERPEKGLAHLFRAAVGRRQLLGPMMRRMVQRVFGGDPTAAVQQLLSDTPVDREQIDEIRRMLDDLDRRQKKEEQ